MIELKPSSYNPNLFFDVDGIIADSRWELSRYCFEILGLKISKDQLEKSKLSEIAGFPKEKSFELITDFYRTRQEDFRLVPGARPAIKKLSKLYNINLISGRPDWAEEPTIRWVEKKLKGLVNRVIFSQAYDIATPFERQTKSKICQKYDGKFIVEDDCAHSIECANNGLNVLYFHGDKEIVHPKIIKVISWKEIMEYGMRKLK